MNKLNSLNNIILLYKNLFTDTYGIAKNCIGELEKDITNNPEEAEKGESIKRDIMSLQSIYQNRLATITEIENVISTSLGIKKEEISQEENKSE